MRAIRGLDSPVIHLANGNGLLLASYTSSGNIQLWNVASGALVKEANIQQPGVVAMLMDPGEHWLYTLNRDGIISIFDSATLNLITTLKHRSTDGVGLAILPERTQLYSAFGGGEIVLWDLTIFYLTHALLGDHAPQQIGEIKSILANTNLTNANRQWLEFIQAMLAYKARYDIQIGEPTKVSIGEFDIQL